MSVCRRFSPLNNGGSPVVLASTQAKQSPRFSAAGVIALAEAAPCAARRFQVFHREGHQLYFRTLLEQVEVMGGRVASPTFHRRGSLRYAGDRHAARAGSRLTPSGSGERAIADREFHEPLAGSGLAEKGREACGARARAGTRLALGREFASGLMDLAAPATSPAVRPRLSALPSHARSAATGLS